MAGEVLFKKGPHASRTGFSGQITDADWESLREAAPFYVPDEALKVLAQKVMFIEADSKRHLAFVPSRHQLAQLKKLRKIAKQDKHVVVDADGREHPYAELADDLANLDCSVPERPKAADGAAIQPILDKDGAYTGAIAYPERSTFDRIKDADRAAIQAILDRDGVFVDVDGNEHFSALPATEVVRPFISRQVVHTDDPDQQNVRLLSRIPASVWLPRGIEGFKESVAQAIKEVKAQQDDAGRREQPWKDDLAKLVVEFWQTHCPNERQAANRNSKTGNASHIVEFAVAAFAAAGFRHIEKGGITNLLHDNMKNSQIKVDSTQGG